MGKEVEGVKLAACCSLLIHFFLYDFFW